jgi:retron-type reverse transcriptase
MIADLYSFENLWRQYRACRRNKRNTVNQFRFEIDAEANLLDLQRELREHTYQPGRFICFVTDGPKPREVFAADFRDRIVHHALVSRLEPVFEPRFTHDSYACRKGRAHSPLVPNPFRQWPPRAAERRDGWGEGSCNLRRENNRGMRPRGKGVPCATPYKLAARDPA